MYTNQHTRWEPMALLLEIDDTLTDELCIAAVLSIGDDCWYDLDMLNAVRTETNRVILEMLVS